jgi:hypothetical protein
MSEIKKGALVKIWYSDPTRYEIGVYWNPFNHGQHIVYCGDVINQVSNCIEIPPELANQLEELGR